MADGRARISPPGPHWNRWENGRTPLTDALSDSICKLVTMGVKPSVAAAQMGVSITKFDRWKCTGKKAIETGKCAPKNFKYVAFVLALKKAEAKATSYILQHIYVALEDAGLSKREKADIAFQLLKQQSHQRNMGGDGVVGADTGNEKQAIVIQVIHTDDLPDEPHAANDEPSDDDADGAPEAEQAPIENT